MRNLFLILCLVSFVLSTNAFATNGQWLNDWKVAKKTFEDTTNFKKPGDEGKIMGISYRKSSGIESGLKTLDSAYAKVNKKTTHDNLVDYEKAMKSSQIVAMDYTKKHIEPILAEGMTEFVKKYNVEPTKEEFQAYSKALATLAQSLGKIFDDAQKEYARFVEVLKPLRSLPQRLKDVRATIVVVEKAIAATKTPCTKEDYRKNISPVCIRFATEVDGFVTAMKASKLMNESQKHDGHDIALGLNLYKGKMMSPNTNEEANDYKTELVNMIGLLKVWCNTCERLIVEAVE